jgi:hypothetical protein
MSIYKRVSGNLVVQTVGNTDSVTFQSVTANTANVIIEGALAVNSRFQLPVFANSTARDAAITSPAPGMVVYITGTGMQVRGATSWNTVSGTAT